MKVLHGMCIFDYVLRICDNVARKTTLINETSVQCFSNKKEHFSF